MRLRQPDTATVVASRRRGQQLDPSSTWCRVELAGVPVELEFGLRSTLLLYTGGLVESRRVPRPIGMERLRQVAGEAPCALDAPCDRALDACTAELRRDDDISLPAVRP